MVRRARKWIRSWLSYTYLEKTAFFAFSLIYWHVLAVWRSTFATEFRNEYMFNPLNLIIMDDVIMILIVIAEIALALWYIISSAMYMLS